VVFVASVEDFRQDGDLRSLRGGLRDQAFRPFQPGLGRAGAASMRIAARLIFCPIFGLP
jgi:hypothetical protein